MQIFKNDICLEEEKKKKKESANDTKRKDLSFEITKVTTKRQKIIVNIKVLQQEANAMTEKAKKKKRSKTLYYKIQCLPRW